MTHLPKLLLTLLFAAAWGFALTCCAALAADRTPVSLACSAQADTQGLHGSDRQKFRRHCLSTANRAVLTTATPEQQAAAIAAVKAMLATPK